MTYSSAMSGIRRLALLLSLLVAAPLLVPHDVAAAARKANRIDPVAAEVTRLRATQGLGPVVSDPALTRAARQQADAMARERRMSHDVAGSLSSRLAAAGVRARSGAENVAAGQKSLSEVMTDWMASSGHRANLLMRDATRVGLARTDGPGGPYWALLLASPEPAAPRAGTSPGPGIGLMFGIPVPLTP